MRMPAFSAEAALGNSTRRYGVSVAGASATRDGSAYIAPCLTFRRGLAAGAIECDLGCYLQCRYIGTGSPEFCTSLCCAEVSLQGRQLLA
jgi:hypothetical protein